MVRLLYGYCFLTLVVEASGGTTGVEDVVTLFLFHRTRDRGRGIGVLRTVIEPFVNTSKFVAYPHLLHIIQPIFILSNSMPCFKKQDMSRPHPARSTLKPQLEHEGNGQERQVCHLNPARQSPGSPSVSRRFGRVCSSRLAKVTAASRGSWSRTCRDELL